MNQVLACLCDPIDDPAADDSNVPVRSPNIKLIVLGLCAAALGISVSLILVCATTGTKDMSWRVALTCIGLCWACVVMAALGLYAQHPWYRSKMVGWFSWCRKKKTEEELETDADLIILLDE